MTVLELHGICKAFGPVSAVRNVDLRLGVGGRTAIVGPSGCGKTTLLRLIAGFEIPDAGSIVLNGECLADAGGAVPAHLRGIGMVAQDGALFPHLSIADNIGFGIPRADAARARRITALADTVGLARSSLDRRPHQLSGGQQQRVALARALARKPGLMLFDEPFSALDTDLRSAMREAVMDLLADAGVATIIVTHDQAEALSFADQVAVMFDGAFLEVGTPQDLYWRPRTQRTAESLGDAIVLPATMRAGRADCALGLVEVANPAGTEIARIMLRPEQVHLTRCAPGQIAAQPHATVIAVDFRGPASLVTVQLAPGMAPPNETGDPVMLHLVQASNALLKVGDTVTFMVAGNAHVLGPGGSGKGDPHSSHPCGSIAR